jgi:mono/diheme cytochrome c family protein
MTQKGWAMTSQCNRSLTIAGRVFLLAILGVGLLFVSTPKSMAAPKAQALKNGEMLARENCASCHATTEKGESPNVKAPPFRTLSKRYKLDDLEESLAEGITIGHGNANMPHFIFEPDDIGDLIAYLKKLNRY